MARPSAAQKGAVSFDTISIDDARGKRRVSVAEFLKLPLDERVRLILGGKLEFWSGDQLIDRRVALRSLMDSMNKVSGR